MCYEGVDLCAGEGIWVGAAKVVNIVFCEIDCRRSVVNLVKVELVGVGRKGRVVGVGFGKASGGVERIGAGGIIEVGGVLESMAWVCWVRHCGTGGEQKKAIGVLGRR